MQEHSIINDTERQEKISNSKSNSKSINSKSNNKSNQVNQLNQSSNVEFLSDKRKNGKERPWKENKVDSRFLSTVYNDMSTKTNNQIEKGKYERKRSIIHGCGDVLTFAVDKDTAKKKLIQAYFCKSRLCPMCAWRKSLKLFSDVLKIMNYIKADNGSTYPKCEFLFITLTVKNCKADELSKTLTDMGRGFVNLLRRGKFAKNVLGAYRGFEITYNEIRDDYHPHIHAIVMVKPSYFSSGYVTHSELCTIWAKKMKLGYIPVCDIRKVKGNVEQGVAEACKYPLKSNEYIKHHDINLSSTVTEVFEKALYHKRLTSFYGVMKEVHNLLGLKDVEDNDNDLVKINEDGTFDTPDNVEIERYVFNVGYNNYLKKLV